MAGVEPDGKVVGPVGRVRPGLRLQAEGVGLPVEPAVLARDRAVEEVAGIELEAGLVANWFGAPFAVVSGGLACLVATAWIGAATPRLRRYRRGGEGPAPLSA